MKFSLRTAHGWLSAQPVKQGKIARWEWRDIPEPGEWETFDLRGLEWLLALVPPPPVPPLPPPVHPPSVFDPAVRQPWPRPMPPDIDTTNLLEVTDRVDWTLMFYDCSDDRSAWVGYVMDTAGEGHDIGWKADGYWRTEKMSKAEGNGKGYVWPPQ